MLRHLVLPVIILIALAFTAFGQDVKVKSLSKQERETFLATRLPSGGVTGTFDSYCSLLFALHEVAIHTEDKEINATPLQTPFPGFYKPTWQELFDAIAFQTRSSWTYEGKRNYWVFARPALQKPYTIDMAAAWEKRDMGAWNGYKPPNYPVGMDVYFFGMYSSDKPKDAAALWEKVRDFWALNFASKIKKDAGLADMKKLTIDGVEALYFEGPAPRNNLLWRQWVLVKDGKTFFILSTLPMGDKAAMAEVDGMIKTFKVTQ